MTAPTDHLQTAIDELVNIPPHWQLTPLGKVTDGVVNPKAPYTFKWQDTDISLNELETALLKGKATGYGLRLGKPSHGLFALDYDGNSAIAKGLEIFGELPQSVSWTSGKEGRYQILFQLSPEQQQLILDAIERSGKKSATKKIACDEGEGLEFRYTGAQSVLPPSMHPTQGFYKWINSPIDTPVAELPQIVINYWLELLKPKTSKVSTPKEVVPSNTRARAHAKVDTLFAIPLDECLAKSHRAILGGVSEGGRNNTALSLARDLLGAESYLNSNGHPFTGNARDLFDRFCSGCNPSIDLNEADSIWNSANSYSPNPACHEEGLQNILDAWDKKRDIEINGAYPRYESTPSKGLCRIGYTQKDEDDGDGFETDSNGKRKPQRTYLGNHLTCLAYVNNPDGNGAGLQLELKGIRGNVSRLIVNRGAILSDSSSVLSELANHGYHFIPKKKKQLIEYLFALGGDVEKTYTITDGTGWVKNTNNYVQQHKTNGDPSYVFRDIEPLNSATTEIKGTLEDWQKHVAAKCAGNSRLIFALGIAFAAVLLEVVGMESGGFHLFGTTSKGKTTTLKVAISVTGEKSVPSFRNTSNGLEAVCGSHNHALFPLDELAQADPKQVAEIIYMIFNGQPKTRMSKDLKVRKSAGWNLLALTSGEIGIAAHLASGGIIQKGGHEVRLPDIPAVPPNSLYGVFETIHGYETSKAFAEDLEAACAKYHGTAIDEFLNQLIENRKTDGFDESLKDRVSALSKKISAKYSDHAVTRVANRFAVVQVGLELAHSFGVIPFGFENIPQSVTKIFTDWVDSRGGDGSIEVRNACERINHLIVSNLHSDRMYDLSDRNVTQKVRNLLGYAKSDEHDAIVEVWVPIPVFDAELAKGTNKPQLIAELHRRGWLEKGSDDRPTQLRQFKGKRSRFYILKVCVFGDSPKTMDHLDHLPETGTSKGDDETKSDPTAKTPLDHLDHFLPKNAGSSDSDESDYIDVTDF